MELVEAAKKLILSKNYPEALKLLNKEVSQDSENSDAWYYKAILSLRLKNYDNAHEFLERAAMIKSKPEYYKLMGVAHMEIYEIEDALIDFQKAINLDKKDFAIYFFVAICYLFINDPRSKGYIQAAYLLDKKKTKELAKSFYNAFFKNSSFLDNPIKKEVEQVIENIPA
ncbi:MAG: tetratricopeptide repeat protein [Candidatus Micrarchaeota archaeon]